MSHPRQPARRRRLLSGLALGVAVATTAVTAAACGGGSSGLGSPDITTLRVGVVDSVGVVPFEIGISTTYHSFSDAGLAITEQKFASQTDEIAALAANKIDIAYGEYSQFLSGGANGTNLAGQNGIRIVSEAYDAAPGTIALVVRRGGTAPSLPLPANRDFCKGNYTIGVTSYYSTEYLALANWLQSQSTPVAFKECASIVALGDPTTAIKAVASGQLTAAALQEPYVTGGEIDASLRVAADLASGNAAGVPVDGYFATTAFVTKYPRTTAIFAAVMAKLQQTGGQRIAVEAALGTQTGNDPLVTATMQMGTYPTVVLPAKLQIVNGLMNSAGTINGPLNIATLTDLGTA
jgi:ABC-type nitrate/sulfonate/bicarbonate transport system substrate-binding protein